MKIHLPSPMIKNNISFEKLANIAKITTEEIILKRKLIRDLKNLPSIAITDLNRNLDLGAQNFKIDDNLTSIDEHLLNERALRCQVEFNSKILTRNIKQAEYIILRITEDAWVDAKEKLSSFSKLRWANMEASLGADEVKEMSMWQIDTFETDTAIYNRIKLKNELLLQRIDLIMSVSEAQLYPLKDTRDQLIKKMMEIQNISLMQYEKLNKEYQKRNKEESSFASLRESLEKLVEASEHEQEELKQETEWYLKQYKAELSLLRSNLACIQKSRDELLNKTKRLSI